MVSIPSSVINNYIIAIGASTGGVEASKKLLRGLQVNMPGIVMVQHMPPGFTSMYARSLDQELPFRVCEIKEGTRIEPGGIYVGQAGRQFIVQRSGGCYIAHMGGEDKVSGHCPSVDVLFESVARAAGSRAAGIILTGMGADGALGLLSMRKAGAFTIGQDESTSLVYGMPRKAYEFGAVVRQFRLEEIAGKLQLHLMGCH